MHDIQKKLFLKLLWEYFDAHRRELPWREPSADGTFDPYRILVSEVMLQQTQVARVTEKFQRFITAFPTIEQLASADFAEVLRLWSGLGYNRRARYLYDAAKQLVGKPFPTDLQKLVDLKGIGHDTAAAILVYTYNQPLVFVETNVRSVVLHHFFKDKDVVSDTDIRSVMNVLIDKNQPRLFYWALMDYGTHLKKTGADHRRSKQYKKQSQFEGSDRQLRGEIVRHLLQGATIESVRESLSDTRFDSIVEQLKKDGILNKEGQSIKIASH